MVRVLSAFDAILREPAAPDRPTAGGRDVVLAAVVAGATLVEGALRPELADRWLWVVVTAGLTPALVWRRARPLAGMIVVFGGLTVLSIGRWLAGPGPMPGGGELDPDLYSSVGFLALPWALARWASARHLAAGLGVLAVRLGLPGLIGAETAADVAGGMVISALVVTGGRAVRYRGAARARELDQVRMLERERLARDLHDTVAHHVSAMAVRAQAGLATSRGRDDGATEALTVIEAEARRTLVELRTLVRVLRRPGQSDPGHEPGVAPVPGLADLRRLAGPDPAGGPEVRVELSGPVDGIPASVGTALYRLAQESVTNARRHARGATGIDVVVVAGAGLVRLRVDDDGRGTHPGRLGRDGSPGARSGSAGGGFGLIGMRERTELLGGRFRAGPSPGGGWEVAAELPCDLEVEADPTATAPAAPGDDGTGDGDGGDG